MNGIIVGNIVFLTPRDTFLYIFLFHVLDFIVLVIVVNQVNRRDNRIDLLLPEYRVEFLDFVGEQVRQLEIKERPTNGFGVLQYFIELFHKV